MKEKEDVDNVLSHDRGRWIGIFRVFPRKNGSSEDTEDCLAHSKMTHRRNYLKKPPTAEANVTQLQCVYHAFF
jgi:hypothetical protein